MGRPAFRLPQVVAGLRDKMKISPNGCWEWLGGKDKDGYGLIKFYGRSYRVHRFCMYLFGFLQLRDRRCALHSCDNPSCFNPKHLFIGTIRDNVLDSISKGRWSKRCGEDNHYAKLTREKVITIRSLYNPPHVNYEYLAKMFGTSPTNVGVIIRGESWRHLLV